MTFVVMMHQYGTGEQPAGAALVHHADPSGVYQRCGVGMILECSSGELLARAVFTQVILHVCTDAALTPHS